jgi:selenocysteine lyase/cysteine desulfurase
MALSSYLKEKIIESWGEEKLFSPTDEELSSGLVAFNPFDDPYNNKKTSEVYRKLLDDHTIVIRTTCFKDTRSDTQSKRALRISTHIYNNYRQIDRVLELIKTIIADL